MLILICIFALPLVQGVVIHNRLNHNATHLIPASVITWLKKHS